jgi:gamma-butyrobetaine dioxygenase
MYVCIVCCVCAGSPRETFYGAMWDTAPKDSSQVNDTAYSRDALHPHTDTCYLLDSPGLQLFNCVAQAVREEDGNPDAGLTKLVDGFAIAERLRLEYPDSFKYFTTTPLRWHSLEDGTHAAATALPITLDPLTGTFVCVD